MPFTAKAAVKPFKRQLHVTLVVAGVGDISSSAMRVGVDHLERSFVTSKNKLKKNVKGSHKTQPRVWPGPHACAQPITLAVAAMDSCFGLVRPHQHGIAVRQKKKNYTLSLQACFVITHSSGDSNDFE